MPAASRADWETKLPTLLAGGGCVVLAEADGAAIGFACARPVDDDGIVYVNNLHALPDRKGLGIGSALLAAVARHARASGARAMHLHVLETNAPAIAFYERRGWRAVGRKDHEWAGETVVALRYAIALT